ncbi:FdtA/QdtA family cupin domain-containing protein [Bacillus tianshenii]|nr:FdtA/QdtA family cupin domain-containing protein [Bacillus tianshenii]
MDVKKLDFNMFNDERGSLIALEQHKEIPFEIKRIYYIFNNELDCVRGKHAHKHLEQVLICVNGSCDVLTDDGKTKEIATLDNPNKALYIGNMVWREMFNFSKGCVLLVIASELYDQEDYIKDYNLFLEEVS